MDAVLGIDTSCYTTSCALCGLDGSPVDQQRVMLPVGQGACGLRQSEAVFSHIKLLPRQLELLLAEHPDLQIKAVCASVKPLDHPDSYMPVFMVGAGVAQAISASLRIPFYETDHQHGHMEAAKIDSGLSDLSFLAFHLSGGTTQIIAVNSDSRTLIGRTLDISAGQWIDRVGVAMGLSFPAGPKLEELAQKGKPSINYPCFVDKGHCSFSGVESAANRDIRAGIESLENIAASVFYALAETIIKMIVSASCETGLKSVLLMGGVSSSLLLRSLLLGKLQLIDSTISLFFGKTEYSGDNAIGVAIIGSKQRQKEGI